MMHSNSSSKKLFNKNFASILSLIFAIAGFFDATYLTIIHYQNVIPPCTLKGCEVVLTSKFSMLGPIPISLIGVGFYITMIILLLVFRETKKKMILNALFALGIAVVIVSMVLVGLQAFVLHAFCQYCLLSELMNTLLFLSILWLWKE
ncbi:MAG: vitamin K epoxide reductase family protein [Candidatus Levyibacteriota bacterium]